MENQGASIIGFVLRAPNVQQLTDFYKQIGLTFNPEKHGDGPAHVSNTLKIGAVLEIYPRNQRNPDFSIIIKVPSLQTVLNRLAKVKLLVKRDNGNTISDKNSVYIYDPCGHLVLLTDSNDVG